ncbi:MULTISPECIES: hypothetical protein [Halolamina]|uniref:Uncharacterized protein n=1 Tax=Halolamina pelagica TaxID=699431 RepID=A0A1I5RKA3_9EURY|nr:MULTISPECIES: hypothetical protein [Halolamina]NHX35223.1 hypothetical protein [Halolamina sp. R1-12]SFP58757.1 hypothetical protein SAMN05216277_10512 [Halolamina pelagica]
MPSTTRRRLLASLGVAGAAGVAGCAGQVPGTSPRDVDATETGGRSELHWEYPAAVVDGDSEGIGYASVTFERERSSERALRFGLNTTVGGIAASEQYTEYEADWARFRLGPPSDYDATHQYRMWVRPPTRPELRARYDRRGGRRELVIELPEIDGGGTIRFPLVFEPVETAPEQLHCSFTVQASEPGPFGESVRAGGRGRIDPAAARSA